MTDNVLQTLQQLIQDVIAPDVRELKVRVSSLEKQNEIRFNALQSQNELRFTSLETQNETRFTSLENQLASSRVESAAQFKTILSAIGESKAQTELAYVRELAALSERVAILESKRH